MTGDIRTHASGSQICSEVEVASVPWQLCGVVVLLMAFMDDVIELQLLICACCESMLCYGKVNGKGFTVKTELDGGLPLMHSTRSVRPLCHEERMMMILCTTSPMFNVGPRSPRKYKVAKCRG